MEGALQGNFLAYLALYTWPLVAIGLFAALPARWACAITLIGGDMFLPSNLALHIPGLPELDKDPVLSISAMIGALVVKPKAILGSRATGRRYNLFVGLLLLHVVLTCLSNPDSIRVGRRLMPGLGFHDVVSMSIRIVLCWWPAFFLGRKLFTKAADLEVLCTVLTVGGLIYSLFIFVELKMSPQFNNWIYGYRQSAFDQEIRAGGYRPVVFMRHGLNLALFMLMSLIGATGLARARVRLFGIQTRWMAIYLAVVLAACHSAGALVYAVVLVPVLIWARPRWQARLATVLAGLVLVYPLLRLADLVPVDSILGFFETVMGAERAGSLGFRLKNEAQLLERAIQRPWFGWGGWGRQFVYSQQGALLSVVDGEWIEVLGEGGLLGFFSVFGLMLWPIFAFARRKLLRITGRREAAFGSAVLFMSVAYVVDLLPNAGVASYLIMMVGALAGIDVDESSEALRRLSTAYGAPRIV
jgi:hypothetical protein